jgi:hypothetical protein
MTSANVIFILSFSRFTDLIEGLKLQPMCVVPLKELIHMKFNGIQIP